MQRFLSELKAAVPESLLIAAVVIFFLKWRYAWIDLTAGGLVVVLVVSALCILVVSVLHHLILTAYRFVRSLTFGKDR